MTEDVKLKIDNMMVMISISERPRDSDDALVCCIENTIEDRIIDSGASFHASYCKEEIERFKLCSDKVRLADDKTLDIASLGYFDEEGYHVGYGDQQWKVTKGSVVVAHENKRGSVYMVEVYPEGIGVIIDGSGSAAMQHQRLGDMSKIGMKMSASKGNVPDIQKAMALHLLHQYEDPTTMILLSKVATGVAVETPLQFGVAERLNRTFRVESTRLRAEAPKMLWVDSVSTTYLTYRIPYVPIRLRIPEEEWRGKDTSLAHLKVFGCDSFVKLYAEKP
ncbi:hypothetical protein Tco_0316182 [Tanacetum coccineum]